MLKVGKMRLGPKVYLDTLYSMNVEKCDKVSRDRHDLFVYVSMVVVLPFDGQMRKIL